MTHDQREQIAAAEAITPGGWSVWVQDEDQQSWLRIADNLSGLDAHHLASKLNIIPAKVVKTNSTGREIAQVLYPEMFDLDFQEGDRVRLISVGREGEVVPRPWTSDTTPERYITVHWDGNPPNHTASIPPENLEKIKCSTSYASISGA